MLGWCCQSEPEKDEYINQSSTTSSSIVHAERAGAPSQPYKAEPAPAPAEKGLAGLDCYWIRKGGSEIARMEGWSSGGDVTIVWQHSHAGTAVCKRMSSKVIQWDHQIGQTFLGTVQDDGTIQWSDSDVWLPLALSQDERDMIAKMPMGHDLTMKAEHEKYMKIADELYKKDLTRLRSIEAITSSIQTDSFKYPTMFHIALKNAISKKLFQAMEPIHCTVVFALYKENNRILPKGDKEGESHKNGEDFIRRKYEQMTWLFDGKKDSSWSLLGVDDGCPNDSTGLMLGIAKKEGYSNVTCHKLKEAIVKGQLKGLDVQKLKSEAWSEDDMLVKASQKAGAILYGLELASAEKHEGKKHIIVYTDSDLSTDLALCGLNFHTILTGNVECSVSQRFGEPYAVNCGKLLAAEEGGGIAAGMPRESMVHLSLRHKLRMNLLPPLAPITDTNCGHKALTPETAALTVSKVKDYKGSFDMDWLMCVGVCAAASGKNAIATTPIPWVNSVGESNFWSAPSGDEDAAAKKLKSCTSWHGIFKAMIDMYSWHQADLEKLNMVTAESKAYVQWVSAMDVQQYMRLSDAILASLEGKDVNMPEPSIMAMSLEDLKKLAA